MSTVTPTDGVANLPSVDEAPLRTVHCFVRDALEGGVGGFVYHLVVRIGGRMGWV